MSEKKIAKPDFLMEACGIFLSDWDKEKFKTGQKLVANIEENGGAEVTFWEPFENYPVDEILENIEVLCGLLERMWDTGFRAGQNNPKKIKRMYNRS